MTAGRRDQLVILQRYTTTQDEYGEEVQTWAGLGTEWAAVFYGRGDERRQAAMEQGSQAATFRFLSNTQTRALSIRDRIVVDTVIWDILGIAPMDRARIEVTAVSSGQTIEVVHGDPGQLDFSDSDNSGLLALILEDA